MKLTDPDTIFILGCVGFLVGEASILSANGKWHYLFYMGYIILVLTLTYMLIALFISMKNRLTKAK